MTISGPPVNSLGVNWVGDTKATAGVSNRHKCQASFCYDFFGDHEPEPGPGENESEVTQGMR